MISREQLEGYMHELALTYEEQGEDLWIVSGDQTGLESVVVMRADPVVVIQVKVMKAPQKLRAELFEQLLRLNATDLVHGAYALQGDDIVLIDSLEGESMDLNEFQASLDSFGVALSQHYHILAKYRS
jgi:predicted house-cleaning NTP pyrophosphatase (Maf/HAM1 superfamily)